MSNLLQEIEAQIAGAKAATAKQNVGVVREIGDGVAKIEGLTDAMLNEMLDFGNGITGIALNLEETEVGAIILGDYTQIKEGREVRTTSRSTARGRSRKTPSIRWKKSPRASSNAGRSASRCRRASWPLTR
jgi:F0F1-type ATP synthase alpha subunit